MFNFGQFYLVSFAEDLELRENIIDNFVTDSIFLRLSWQNISNGGDELLIEEVLNEILVSQHNCFLDLTRARVREWGSIMGYNYLLSPIEHPFSRKWVSRKGREHKACIRAFWSIEKQFSREFLNRDYVILIHEAFSILNFEVSFLLNQRLVLSS